jgi:replicative DNA helicase
MSLASKTIRSCIEHDSPSSFRAIDPSLLVSDDETALFEWVRAHLGDHQQLPAVATITSHGFELPRTAPEPPSYYLTELRKRFVYKHITDRLPTLTAALEERRVADAVDLVRTMLSGTNALVNPGAFNEIEELTQQVLADYQFAKDHPGIRGITTGYPTLDELTLGAQGGDLVVVCGRTGMGKSWVLVKMAHAAWSGGYNIGLVSMEMTLLPIARRWVGLHSKINPNLIRAGHLSTMGEQHLMEKAQEIAQERPNHAYFLSGDFSQRVGQVERMLNEYELDAIYIDAAYLLTPEGQKRGTISRWEQIADVIKELKRLALKYNKPVIISVQMNRNVKKSTTRTLDSSDIGGSDSIPQDASILLGLRQGPAPFERTRRCIDLFKNRDGEESTIQINYQFNPVNLDESEMLAQHDSGVAEWM